MKGISLEPCDISPLENQVIQGGTIQPMPSSFYKALDPNIWRNFMLTYGLYTLPTTELIQWLQDNIEGTAIEIGCGHGSIGRALSITITDSKLQESSNPEIVAYYKLMGQPRINYPKDVLKYEAIEAIKTFKPDTVIGSYITHKYSPQIGSGNMYGVLEGKILQLCKKYIHIGNTETHKDKPILKHPHEKHYFDWLITRSVNQTANRIYIFKSG